MKFFIFGAVQIMEAVSFQFFALITLYKTVVIAL